MPVLLAGINVLKPAPKIKDSAIKEALRARGFSPSIWHSTVGKLRNLYRSSPEKYQDYLEFFRKIHEDLRMPGLLLTLILPSVEELMHMDVKVLSQAEIIPLIRRNYARSENRTCDLRNLPRLYPELHHSK